MERAKLFEASVLREKKAREGLADRLQQIGSETQSNMRDVLAVTIENERSLRALLADKYVPLTCLSSSSLVTFLILKQSRMLFFLPFCSYCSGSPDSSEDRLLTNGDSDDSFSEEEDAEKEVPTHEKAQDAAATKAGVKDGMTKGKCRMTFGSLR